MLQSSSKMSRNIEFRPPARQRTRLTDALDRQTPILQLSQNFLSFLSRTFSGTHTLWRHSVAPFGTHTLSSGFSGTHTLSSKTCPWSASPNTTWLCQNLTPAVFVAKALSRISLKRHNGAMQLDLIRNIGKPTELVRFLVTANIVLYITSLFMALGAVNYNLNPMVFLSPGTGVLFKLGASGTLPVFAEDRWWSLITANYLHGSLLHLLFNVSALRTIGNINIEIYAPSRSFLIYFLGGIFSMAVSSLAGIPLTLGASGAICALIGSMSYDEWRASKGNLKKRIVSVGIWVALLVITGLVLPNVNNWAHAAGFVSGFLLGFLLWTETSRNESITFRVVATSCMLLTIGALIYGLLFS